MPSAALWSCWWSSLLWPQTHITYFRKAPNVGFCPHSLMSIFLHTEGDQILSPNLGDSVLNAQLWLLINCWETHSIQFKETAQERKHKPKSRTYLLSHEALALDSLFKRHCLYPEQALAQTYDSPCPFFLPLWWGGWGQGCTFASQAVTSEICMQ